jgi:hypothetical protein
MRYWNLCLRLGGVDVLRVQPTLLDPVHGISVSEKVTVPTFKVMAEVDSISNQLTSRIRCVGPTQRGRSYRDVVTIFDLWTSPSPTASDRCRLVPTPRW